MGNLWCHPHNKARKFRAQWGMHVPEDLERAANRWMQTMHDLFHLNPVLGIGEGGYATRIKVGQLVKVGDLDTPLDPVEAIEAIKPRIDDNATVTHQGTYLRGFVFNLVDCDPIKVELDKLSGKYKSPTKIAADALKGQYDTLNDKGYLDGETYVVTRVIEGHVCLHFRTKAEAQAVVTDYPDVFKLSEVFTTAAVTKAKVPILFGLYKLVGNREAGTINCAFKGNM